MVFHVQEITVLSNFTSFLDKDIPILIVFPCGGKGLSEIDNDSERY